MKQRFEMSDVQLEKLIYASRPTPVMYLSGGQRMYDSPRENAHRAWRLLGDEMGFEWKTVEPLPGYSDKVFMAEAKPTEAKP